MKNALPVCVTVSGSFRRHLAQIEADVTAFIESGATVLSPSDPRVVDAFGDFLFVASDHHRTVKRLQDRHLASIEASAFLWLVTPDGYVGPSTAFEVGAAVMLGIPIKSQTPPTDLTLRQYVEVVPSPSVAVHTARLATRRGSAVGMLVSPHEATEMAHDLLDQLGRGLTRVDSVHRERDHAVEETAERLRRSLKHL